MRIALALSFALAALVLPGSASADVLTDYQAVLDRKLGFAPLVPTTAPPSLSPIDRTLEPFGSARRSGYGLRLAAFDPAAVIALEGNGYRSLAAGLRDYRRRGFSRQSTRIRGRRGHLLTRRGPPTTRALMWSEGGVVYTLGSGTPRTVSLRQLRATATGLQRLQAAFLGADDDNPDYPAEAFVVLTERTVSAYVSWPGSCTNPDGSAAAARAGTTTVDLVPRSGNRFSIAPPAGWSGTIGGTVAPAAVTIDINLSGTFDGLPCASGPISFTIPQR